MMFVIQEMQPVPLTMSETGVVLAGGTRVTLDTVVGGFNRGATAEEIAQKYPALSLADVYATITYYLRAQSAVDDTIAKREQRRRAVQARVEADMSPVGIRARLLARRGQQSGT